MYVPYQSLIAILQALLSLRRLVDHVKKDKLFTYIIDFRSRNSVSRSGNNTYESARTTPQYVQLEMSPDDSNPQLIFYTHEWTVLLTWTLVVDWNSYVVIGNKLCCERDTLCCWLDHFVLLTGTVVLWTGTIVLWTRHIVLLMVNT